MSDNEFIFEHHLLIAMPSLNDSNFSRSVIYVYEHNEEGAMGVIINKPLHISLKNVLKHLDISVSSKKVGAQPVLMGGPVGQEHGFILHDQLNNDEAYDNDEIALSASKDTLREIAQGRGPDRFLVTLGYSGWSAGQLEKEITDNDWLIAPFEPKILFDTPVESRWEAAAFTLGVDIHTLSDQTGHA